MKTIVLAAGYATRLYPLTLHVPKPLLKVGDRTILDRLLDDIDTIPGISEHIIVTNHKFAGVFRDWAASRHSGSAPVSVPVTVLDDGTETNETRLGAVRDLILALDTCRTDGDILVVAADNILDFSLKGFVEAFHRYHTSMIMCHFEPDMSKLQRTGVVEVDEDMRVLQMQEKPPAPVSHWAVPPFYIYRREDLALVRHAVENGCASDAPGHLARFLSERTLLHAWPMPGRRFDIGSLDSYEEAKREFGCGRPAS